jgi:hypothetical protein
VIVAESDGSTDVIEGGATDTYTVTLASQPVATVVVTIKPDAQTTIAPDSLTFSPATWDNPQVVTVAAVDDAVDEGLHTGTITHTAASADGNYDNIAVNYDNIAVSSVTVNITDKSDKPNTVYLPLIYKMQQGAPQTGHLRCWSACLLYQTYRYSICGSKRAALLIWNSDKLSRWKRYDSTRIISRMENEQ